MGKHVTAVAGGMGLVLAVMSVLLAAPAAWAVTVSEATGKGAYLDSGNVVSTQFKAGIDDLGNIFGQLQQVTNGPGKQADSKFHGTVTCYALLDATTAVFGGFIDSSSDPTLVGQFFQVKV